MANTVKARFSGPVNWVDGMDPDRIADPKIALQDCKASHKWATRELEGETDPHRIRILTDGKKTLGGYCLAPESSVLLK